MENTKPETKPAPSQGMLKCFGKDLPFEMDINSPNREIRRAKAVAMPMEGTGRNRWRFWMVNIKPECIYCAARSGSQARIQFNHMIEKATEKSRAIKIASQV